MGLKEMVGGGILRPRLLKFAAKLKKHGSDLRKRSTTVSDDSRGRMFEELGAMLEKEAAE